MLRTFIEKRRKRPSYVIPFLFFFLEMVLMWLVIGIFNWDLDVTQWHTLSFVFVAIWIIFSSVKLAIVLRRQKLPND